MLPLALLPATLTASLDGVVLDDASVTILLRSEAATCCCPHCGVPSHRLHSLYSRTIADLPLQGRPAALRMVVRRFFCRNAACPRRVFCERVPDLAPAYARCTSRLTDGHRAIAFALGGEAGAAMAGTLGMPTSATTLLRRIKQSEVDPAPPPRVLGVDDWAIRKGLTYGTILVDLERGEVIDLLPGRDSEPLKKWLLEHPGVEVVSRDRASAYALGASEGAPNAVQVADRWHLLKNAREMLERFLERHRDMLHLVAPPALPAGAQSSPAEVPAGKATEAGATPTLGVAPVPVPVPQAGAAQTTSKDPVEAAAAGVPVPTQLDGHHEVSAPPASPEVGGKRQARVDRFNEVKRLNDEGVSIRKIAEDLNLSRNAVRGYLRKDRCPDWRPGQPRPTTLDGFAGWVDGQLRAERTNAAELHPELEARGYRGSIASVRRFVTRRLAVLGKKRSRRNAATPRAPAPSARKLSFDVLRARQKRTGEQQARVDALPGISEEFREVLRLTEEFIAMVRKERKEPLADWLPRAESSASVEMRGFAEGIRQDQAAVAAAMTEVWSNGQVEGQVNRLKVIKRQIYGRAGFALLRRRVLHTG